MFDKNRNPTLFGGEKNRLSGGYDWPPRSGIPAERPLISGDNVGRKDRATVTNVSNKRIFMCVESSDDRPRRAGNEIRAARPRAIRASERAGAGEFIQFRKLVVQRRAARGKRHDTYFRSACDNRERKVAMHQSAGGISAFFHCRK